MLTLEELSTQRANDDAQRLAQAKQPLIPVLAALEESRRVVEKRLPSWFGRANHCQNRRAILEARGIRDLNVNYWLDDLLGGSHNANTGGLLHTVLPQIAGYIDQVKRVTLRDLTPSAALGLWLTYPGNASGLIRAIEDALTAVENNIADGSPLYEAYRRKLDEERSAPTPTAAA